MDSDRDLRQVKRDGGSDGTELSGWDYRLCNGSVVVGRLDKR